MDVIWTYRPDTKWSQQTAVILLPVRITDCDHCVYKSEDDRRVRSYIGLDHGNPLRKQYDLDNTQINTDSHTRKPGLQGLTADASVNS